MYGLQNTHTVVLALEYDVQTTTKSNWIKRKLGLPWITIIQKKKKKKSYTVQLTPPTVTWTSSLLPVSRKRPEIVMRVPPAFGPLDGVTASGIGSWWEKLRGSRKTAWIHAHLSLGGQINSWGYILYLLNVFQVSTSQTASWSLSGHKQQVSVFYHFINAT